MQIDPRMTPTGGGIFRGLLFVESMIYPEVLKECEGEKKRT